MIEEFKTISKFPDYEISNIGNVKSNRYHNKNKLLKQGKNEKGYYCVNLYNNEKMKRFKVHRLVAMAFIHNPNNYKEINHIDGNKTNNNINNLEWCTNKQNIEHSIKNNLKKDNKRIIQYDKNMNYINEYNSISEAHRETNTCMSGICQVAQKKQKTANSFIWRYKDIY